VISTRAPMEMAVSVAFPPAAAVERLGPGSRVANFELLEFVGGGGMGLVFRARDVALARTVAVKVLSQEQAADSEVLLRFRNEAQTAARLNHENIVQVYHSGEEGGLPYIVFEFIEGLNIRALVEKKGVLPLPEAISYTFQVAEALAHAAAQNVVHRDIKPSNILITSRGHAKLIDLGLARLQKIGDGADDLTASGVTLGTFDYISPEQARDPRTADVRSDIYSLGCTLFFMLAGRPPFAQGTVLQKLLQHQGEEPPDVRQFRPELPPETSRLLRRMMAKDPRRRFQSPQQLIEAMALLAEEVGLHPAGPGEKRWVPELPSNIPLLQRHLPWMVPAAALGIAVLVLNFLWSGPAASTDSLPRWLSATEESSAVPPERRTGVGSESNGGGAGAAPAGSAEASVTKLEPGSSTGAEKEPRAVSSPDAGITTTQPASPNPPVPPADAKGSQVRPSTVATDASGGGTSGSSMRPDAVASGGSSSEPSGAGILTGAGGGPSRGAASEGKSPAAVGSEGAAPAPAAAAKTGSGVGVLVVDPTGSGANKYPTLAAACAAAATGDVIELRFNGPRQESPLALSNLKLTIRAAEGYQPVVTFRPADLDPMTRPRAMVSLSGSQLTLVNIALALEIPHEAASDQWSLLESRPAEMIRLEKCSLSISNTSSQLGAYHPDVAFFRVKAGPGAGSLTTGEATAAPQRVTIALVDCVFRGEAVAVCVQDLWPVQFSWENGLLVTTERFLVADGGERTPLPGESIQIVLQHVSAVVRGGLCRFTQSASAPRLLNTQVDCRNSILVGSSVSPLVEHVGAPGAEAARQGFAWNGDRNFYEGFGSFWSLRVNGAVAAEAMSFDAWRDYWGTKRENLPNWHRVQWKQLPAADRPLPSHLPADYALSPSAASANPAIGAASDGRDAGCLFDRLPPLTWPAQTSPASGQSPQPVSAPAPPKS
jgi:eukaryotic-like serine/threonine-protein kinase